MILYEMLEGDSPTSNYEPYEAAKYAVEGHRSIFRAKGFVLELRERNSQLGLYTSAWCLSGALEEADENKTCKLSPRQMRYFLEIIFVNVNLTEYKFKTSCGLPHFIDHSYYCLLDIVNSVFPHDILFTLLTIATGDSLWNEQIGDRIHKAAFKFHVST